MQKTLQDGSVKILLYKANESCNNILGDWSKKGLATLDA